MQSLIYSKAYLPFQRFIALIGFPNGKENLDGDWRFSQLDNYFKLYIFISSCVCSNFFQWMPHAMTHPLKFVLGSSPRSPYVSAYLRDTRFTRVSPQVCDLDTYVIISHQLNISSLYGWETGPICHISSHSEQALRLEKCNVLYHLEVNHTGCHYSLECGSTICDHSQIYWLLLL